MRRNVLLLLVALVAAVGAALFSAPSIAATRVLLDWEDDLRPRSGAYGGDSDYSFIDIVYERLLNVNRRVWILPLRFAYKMSIDVRPSGYVFPGQRVPQRIETIAIIPTWTGGGKRFEGGYVSDWTTAYGKK